MCAGQRIDDGMMTPSYLTAVFGMSDEYWVSQFLVPNLSQEIWLAHRTAMSREHHERQVVTRSSHLH
jgi:hypothetical protein